ncbi:hypothetical protein ACIGO9_28835 [Nocardia asteroides]|uniref:hypothetical protein n=1 Tax=Nocardia asteroides TaxID=1824 RepID=UPI0037C98B26
MDLLDFFRGVLPWSKLARFLKSLPPGSRYEAAMAMDFDVAEYQFAATQSAKSDGAKSPDPRTSSAGHDLQVQTLMTIADLIQQLQVTLIAVNLPEGKQPPKLRLLPRPVSALDVVRARHAKSEVDSALADLGL